MKILKKYLRKTQFLALCLTSILIFTSLIIGHVEKMYQMMLEANNFKTINSVAFYFDEKDLRLENIIKTLKEIESQRNIVIIHEAGRVFIPGASQFGIYFNGMYKNGYNLLEGRFFNPEDFKQNRKVVVIGKKLIDNVKTENGEKYIYRGDEKFLVIGIMGKKNSETQYDSRILYNLNMDLEEKDMPYLQNGFNLDSLVKSEGNLKNIINVINKKNNSSFIRIVSQDNSVSPLISAVQSSRTVLLNFSLIILCIIVTLIKVAAHWIGKIALELGVRRMYGASNKDIILHITKGYLAVSGISLILSIIVQQLLIMGNVFQVQNRSLNIFNVFISVIFIFIIVTIVIGVSAFSVNRTQISYLIKGKV